MINLRTAGAAALALGLLGGSANAGILNISGSVGDSTEMTGATFDGTLSYAFVGGNMGSLTISLTNTTPAPVGGFLTAFVFNSDSTDAGIAVALSSATDADFTDNAGSSAVPFGNPFLAGAGLGGTFLGGGSPNPGIAIGTTETFTFDVTATDAAVLTESNFVEGPYAFDFVVRFRGLANDGSDKVPTPTPGPVALAGIAGLMASRRRR